MTVCGNWCQGQWNIRSKSQQCWTLQWTPRTIRSIRENWPWNSELFTNHDSIREKIDVAPVNIQKLHNSIDYLDKATEDFLDKVSSVSKKKNMSFRGKLTIKKSQKGKSVGGNDTFDSIIVNLRSFNNNISSSRLSFNNIKHSSRNSGKMSQENTFRMSQSRNSSNFNQSRYSVDEGRKSKLINLSEDFMDDVFEENNVSQGS